MRYHLIAVLCGVCCLSIGSDVKTCRDFRTGKFELDVCVVGMYHIIRNDSIQYDVSLADNDTSTYRIEWISDCEYELVMIKGPNDSMQFYAGKRFFVIMKELYEDGYGYETGIRGRRIGRVEGRLRRIE